MSTSWNKVQKVPDVPEVDADASHCTLFRVCLDAVIQIPDLVLHNCRMALNTLPGDAFCKERDVSEGWFSFVFRAASTKLSRWISLLHKFLAGKALAQLCTVSAAIAKKCWCSKCKAMAHRES